MNYTIPSPVKCEHFGLFEISQPLVDSSKKKSSKFEIEECILFLVSRNGIGMDLEEYNFHRLIKIIHVPRYDLEMTRACQLTLHKPSQEGWESTRALILPLSPLVLKARKTRYKA